MFPIGVGRNEYGACPALKDIFVWDGLTKLKVGHLLDVKDNRGVWCAAFVIARKETSVFVKFYGWSERWNCWYNDAPSDALSRSGTHENLFHDEASTIYGKQYGDHIKKLISDSRLSGRVDKKEMSDPKVEVKDAKPPVVRQPQQKALTTKFSELQCPICLESFATEANRIHTPVTLPLCGHSICDECSTVLRYGDCEDQKCPICRADFPSIVGDADACEAFVPSFGLMSAIALIQKTAHRCLLLAPSEHAVFSAGQCVGCGETPSVYCALCNPSAPLCNVCFEDSHRGSWMKSHTKLSLSDRAFENPFCSIHTFERIQWYCLTDSTPLCSICYYGADPKVVQKSSHLNGHHVETIHELSRQKREIVKEHITEMKALETLASQRAFKLDSLLLSLQQKKELHINSLKDLETQFRNVLNAMFEKTRTQYTELYTKQTSHLRDCVKQWKDGILLLSQIAKSLGEPISDHKLVRQPTWFLERISSFTTATKCLMGAVANEKGDENENGRKIDTKSDGGSDSMKGISDGKDQKQNGNDVHSEIVRLKDSISHLTSIPSKWTAPVSTPTSVQSSNDLLAKFRSQLDELLKMV
jgi:hypothetical protein